MEWLLDKGRIIFGISVETPRVLLWVPVVSNANCTVTCVVNKLHNIIIICQKDLYNVNNINADNYE